MADSRAPGGSGAASAAAAGGRPSAAKPRLARSKAACAACHSAKQRCDGPPGPCHRCTTWGTECVFPSAAGPAPKGSRDTTPPFRGRPGVAHQAVTPDVTEQLTAMNARLESLESTLSRALSAISAFTSTASSLQNVQSSASRASGLNPSFHVSRPPGAGSSAGSESSPMAGVTPASGGHGAEHHREDVVGVNAVETAGEAMAVEGLVDLGGPGRSGGANGAAGGSEQQQLGGWDAVRPDVLGRNIMTLEECDAEFEFYFEHLQPWTCLLSTTLDRHPLVVRERSPLLFHAILLITLYYRSRTPGNIILYRAVSSILDSILSPQVLCPQPDQLSFDFVRAVHLLTLYKPLQWAALNARGISDPVQIESNSKMNIRASWILRLLVSRVSAFIGLPSIATTFAQAFANQHVSPIPDSVISQTRLFLGCVFHESHGALQSGKAANFIPQDACKVTRLFASLRKQSSDVRLAASVELVATASNALLARKEDGVLEDEDLRKFDEELDAWTEYWQPLLESQAHAGEAEGGADAEAWSLFYPYASFTRLTVRGFAFNKWRAERKERAAQRAALVGGLALPGGGAPGAGSGPALGAEERESIAKAVQVAEEMMCAVAVSPEGAALRSGMAKPNGASVEAVWASVADGAFTPEPEVVRTLKWATDSLTCVMFSYPLIFLAKLANEGLLRPDLTVISPGSTPLPPAPMAPSDKLCRLFQLGADLLDAIAPNPFHPSVRQAAFLRKVWEAGVSGRRSVTSAPSSPRFPAQAGAQVNPPPLHLDAAAAHLGSSSSSANNPLYSSIPPPPPTFPPTTTAQHGHINPQAHLPPSFAATIAATGSAAATLSSYNPSGIAGDFSLSAAYDPTPVHSPPFSAHSASGTPTHPGAAAAGGAGLGGAGGIPVMEDPFAALLSDVNPALFDGGQSFFSLDGGGVDWPDLGTPGAGGAGAAGGAAGGTAAFGLGGTFGLGGAGFGMHF
ncbi:hypothetical protein JCM8097_001758 [Rhodosporidiobolus ruineniae]